MTFVYIVIGVAIVVGLIYVINNKAAMDFFTGGRAQLGKLGHAAAIADPKAMWEQEMRDAKTDLDHSITDLEESKGLVSELQEQVNEDNKEVALLDIKVKTSLSDDPDDKKGKAAEYVTKLEAAQTRQKRNTAQLTKSQGIYATNLKKFQFAQKKITEKGERGKEFGEELKNSELNARLAKLAQKFNVSTGDLDNHLAEAEAEMRKRIARNNAVGEVQADLGISGLEEAEEDDRLAKASAKLKLEEYRKNMGLNK